jgi:hypothetical protein
MKMKMKNDLIYVEKLILVVANNSFVKEDFEGLMIDDINCD